MPRVNDIMLITSTIVLAATLGGLESDTITLGQACAAYIVATPMNVYSFIRSDLYEPPEK